MDPHIWPSKSRTTSTNIHTYSSYVRITDVALKSSQSRWTIGRSGERGSGIPIIAVWHDDDDDDSYQSINLYIYISIYLLFSLCLFRSLCLCLSLSLSLPFLAFTKYQSILMHLHMLRHIQFCLQISATSLFLKILQKKDYKIWFLCYNGVSTFVGYLCHPSRRTVVVLFDPWLRG